MYIHSSKLERDARLILHRKHVYVFSIYLYIYVSPLLSPAFNRSGRISRITFRTFRNPLERKFLVAFPASINPDVPLATVRYFFIPF